MNDGYSYVSIIIFLGFVLLDAAFYGFGSAIQNINTSNLEREMEDGSKRARKLLHIVNRPTRFVNAIQMTTNLVGMITGAYVLEQLQGGMSRLLNRVEVLPKPWLSVISIVLVGIILILLLMSFGIVIPKRCAAREPEKWGYFMLPIISAVLVPLFPFTWLATRLSYLFLKLVGIDPVLDRDNVTEEDIMSMVNEGHEQGVLEASEAEMITNIFELDDKKAEDIMTHRKNLVALDGAMQLQEAVQFILKEGNNSRYPVYQKDIDDVIGILHMKDALIYSEQQMYERRPLYEIPGLLREAHFIPETRNIKSLFKEMQSQKIHMEIVIDEYGQTAGIVTMEDILEEIVGNILDEYDIDEDYIAFCEDGCYLMSGMTPLDDVAHALLIDFEEEEDDTYDTINGFLISKLDRIPQEDEQPEVRYKGYRLKILKVENKMIHTVRAEKLKENETEKERPEN